MWPTIADIAESVRSGEKTARYWAEKALAGIEEAKEYNAIISVADNALEAADIVDKKIGKGEKVGRLAGVPYIAKDNFLTKDSETTAASNILKGFESPFNATAVQKLQDEGAIMIAKANLDSFAHGGSTENSDMGPTLNPHDKKRVPGGSSGGSAAAVVLGLAPFALGTDTGGSVRLPASFTGAVGYKPTYGLISRYGVVAMASSTDVIGPIANSVEDAALVLDVVAGDDPFDSTMISRDKSAYDKLEAKDLKGVTIGAIKEHMGEGVDEEVKAPILKALDAAKARGATIKEISIPNIARALAVYYIVMPAEVSSNLSRYDGIRYGLSSDEASSIEEVYTSSRTQGFNKEVKRRIMIGTYVLSSGYYDAYYKKAQAVRTLLIEDFNKAFAEVDFLAGPVSPSTAFKLGENTEDPLKMYLVDIMTTAANLVGNPAISVPVAKTGSGLPVGLHLMAPARGDRKLLEVAKLIEQDMEYK